MQQVFQYHVPNSIYIRERNPIWSPDLPFELKLDFELTGLDTSFVNALRRIVLSEVETASVGDVKIQETDNLTVFNTEYLVERFGMLPLHLDTPESLQEFKQNRYVFKLADKEDLNKPIQNNNNADLLITCRDIITLRQVNINQTGGGTCKLCGSPNTNQSTCPLNDSAVKKDSSKHPNAVKMLADKTGVKLPAVVKTVAPAPTPATLAPPQELEDSQLVKAVPRQAETQPDQPAPLPSPLSAPELPTESPEPQYERVETADFFKYLDTYLLKLKRGEHFKAEFAPVFGIGLSHAKWQCATPFYRFKTDKETADPAYSWMTDSKLDPVRDPQNYPYSSDAKIGKYANPDVFKMSIEYNGHYRPVVAWLAAIRSLKNKLTKFLEEARMINGQDEQVGDSDRMSALFNSEGLKNKLDIHVYGETHTLGNLLASHYFYHLEQLVNIIHPVANEAKEVLLTCFSHYKIPHVLSPTENKLVLAFKTPTWSRTQSDQGFTQLLAELATTGKTVNSYDDDIYLKNPSLRLLMIVSESALSIANTLEKEGEKLVEYAIAGQLPFKELTGVLRRTSPV